MINMFNHDLNNRGFGIFIFLFYSRYSLKNFF